MKKILSLVLALAMILMVGAAFAQTVGTAAEGTGTITISNAANGETYKVFKLFDATVGADGAIAYTGNIPNGLSEYFTKDSAGNILKAEGKTDAEIAAAVQNWGKTATGAVAEAESDGSVLVFQGLAYGYYAVTSSQGATVTVDSLNPNADIVDKNTKEPKLKSKVVDDDNTKIGDTVTYTVTYDTSNFQGAGEFAKRIISYTIEDTLPDFLADVTVTSVTIDGVAYTVGDPAAAPQFENKKITIPWVDANNKSLYANGAEVVITYTAVVTEEAAVDGDGNENEVKLTWKDIDNDDHEDKDHKKATIFTYALALKKVDQSGNNRGDATFRFPFYVKATADTDGAYIYAGTTAGEGLVNTLTTPANGEITIKGLEAGTAIEIEETVAPDGYNKLTFKPTVTPVKTGETTTTTSWKVKDGKVVEDSVEEATTVTYTNENLAATATIVINNKGTELPSTGGIGTTIFYVLGGILVIGAAVILVARRKAHD